LLYLLCSSLIVILLISVFDLVLPMEVLDWDQYGISSGLISSVLGLATFVLFVAIQSARLFRTKKYRVFALINFVSLPIVLGISVMLMRISSSSIAFRSHISTLTIFFIIYLLYSPLQKKILTRVISLPKE
jgi:hypothetical protein